MTYKAPVDELSCPEAQQCQSHFPKFQYGASYVISTDLPCTVTHSAPLYSNLPSASPDCGLQLIRGKLGQHWLDDEAGRQLHRLAVPQG